MVAAHAGFAGELGEPVLLLWRGFDLTKRERDPLFIASGNGSGVRRCSRIESKSRSGKAQCELFECVCAGVLARGLGFGLQRNKTWYGRQNRALKASAAETRLRRSDGFKESGLEMEGDAPVAHSMRMAALVASARISEQDCTGRERRRASLRAILESAGGHDRDRDARVPLFKDRIARSMSTDDIVHAPVVARSQDTRGYAHAGILTDRARESLRNFSQAEA